LKYFFNILITTLLLKPEEGKSLQKGQILFGQNYTKSATVKCHSQLPL
jgi:hypothetical protein